MGTRKYAVAAIVVTALAAGAAPASAGPAQADFVPATRPVPGSFLVSLEGGDARVASAGLADRYGGTVERVFTVAMNGFLVHGLSDRQARRLAADPAVRSVHQDGTSRLADTQTNPTYGIDRVDQRALPLDRRYSYNTTAATVTTYVLDTGIRKTHTDFEGRVSDGYDFVDDDKVAQDCHGHGTHVAGTIGGKRWGVAKKTKLVALRTFDCAGTGPDSDGVAAIEWVAKNAVKPAVVNGSFTFDTPGIGDEAIGRLTAAGIAFVVAAGNDSSDACGVGPSRHPDVVSVGATDSGDNRAYFSNYGTCVDVFAPGDGVTSASYASDTASTSMSGTSMASPHVAGGAALYLATNPTATPAQVRAALTGAATPNVVKNRGTGSPNRLLYTAGFGA
ncbi:hypothetical protein GCM10022243_23110 [Saccharothrix violaceirubra]|uniref:Subtilisin family serine protease n=1 Tax=Saccharothrix violaceirubra TaxID=413306 RepID=A0A7W7T1X0_9PSEU|nr:S8 family peptidase [Saccharothrix violaceirubra]MBB4964751.1 subtilisin family serine protease [Saccharothrix violaceirubra]